MIDHDSDIGPIRRRGAGGTPGGATSPDAAPAGPPTRGRTLVGGPAPAAGGTPPTPDAAAAAAPERGRPTDWKARVRAFKSVAGNAAYGVVVGTTMREGLKYAATYSNEALRLAPGIGLSLSWEAWVGQALLAGVSNYAIRSAIEAEKIHAQNRDRGYRLKYEKRTTAGGNTEIVPVRGEAVDKDERWVVSRALKTAYFKNLNWNERAEIHRRVWKGSLIAGSTALLVPGALEFANRFGLPEYAKQGFEWAVNNIGPYITDPNERWKRATAGMLAGAGYGYRQAIEGGFQTRVNDLPTAADRTKRRQEVRGLSRWKMFWAKHRDAWQPDVDAKKDKNDKVVEEAIKETPHRFPRAIIGTLSGAAIGGIIGGFVPDWLLDVGEFTYHLAKRLPGTPPVPELPTGSPVPTRPVDAKPAGKPAESKPGAPAQPNVTPTVGPNVLPDINKVPTVPPNILPDIKDIPKPQGLLPDNQVITANLRDVDVPLNETSNGMYGKVIDRGGDMVNMGGLTEAYASLPLTDPKDSGLKRIFDHLNQQVHLDKDTYNAFLREAYLPDPSGNPTTPNPDSMWNSPKVNEAVNATPTETFSLDAGEAGDDLRTPPELGSDHMKYSALDGWAQGRIGDLLAHAAIDSTDPDLQKSVQDVLDDIQKYFDRNGTFLEDKDIIKKIKDGTVASDPKGFDVFKNDYYQVLMAFKNLSDPSKGGEATSQGGKIFNRVMLGIIAHEKIANADPNKLLFHPKHPNYFKHGVRFDTVNPMDLARRLWKAA